MSSTMSIGKLLKNSSVRSVTTTMQGKNLTHVGQMWSVGDDAGIRGLEERILKDHPLQGINTVAD